MAWNTSVTIEDHLSRFKQAASRLLQRPTLMVSGTSYRPISCKK